MTPPDDSPIQKFDDGVPASSRAILVRLYERAGEEIAGAVLHPTGKTFDARRFRQARAAILIRQIDGVLAETHAKASALLKRAVEQSVSKGLASAVRELRDIGMPAGEIPVTGGLNEIDRRTVAVIAADMAIDLDDALTGQAKRAQRFLRQAAQKIVPDSEISAVVAQGAITGDVAATVRAMRGLLNARQIEDYRRAGSQLIEVGKATMTLRAYADMLVRTRTRQATVQARHERLVSNGCDLVSVVGSISENFCTAYVGSVFSISGHSDRYPSLSDLPGGGPPFHPNCSKSTRAYVERFATDAQERNADMTDERFITTDRDAAQRLFDRKDEAANVRRRYKTTA